jgi:hypothetical protein
MLCVALGFFTYYAMCYNHLLTIFLQNERTDGFSALARTSRFHISSGLNLITHNVGLIMSVNGVIALFVQGAIFPVAAGRLGVWHVFILVTVPHPAAYVIVPCLAFLPDNMLMISIYVCPSIRNLIVHTDIPYDTDLAQASQCLIVCAWQDQRIGSFGRCGVSYYRPTNCWVDVWLRTRCWVHRTRMVGSRSCGSRWRHTRLFRTQRQRLLRCSSFSVQPSFSKPIRRDISRRQRGYDL